MSGVCVAGAGFILCVCHSVIRCEPTFIRCLSYSCLGVNQLGNFSVSELMSSSFLVLPSTVEEK